MSRRAGWILRGVALLLAVLPVLATGFHPSWNAGHFAFYAELNDRPWFALDPGDAATAVVTWRNFAETGAVVVAVAPLLARGRALRPVAAVAGALLIVIAAVGLYVGVYSGFGGLLDGFTGMPDGAWTEPGLYALAAAGLLVVAVRARPGPVILEAP